MTTETTDTTAQVAIGPASLYHGDCINLLHELPESSIDLIVSSPPYSMGKEYESSGTLESFEALHARIAPELTRILRPGGSIFWQVGYFARNRSVTPLDFLAHQSFSRERSLVLRNRIIWTYSHGPHARIRFSGRHETILWHTKGDNYVFNLDDIRVPQKYPGKRAYNGANRGNYSGNPLGKNPSDVWEIPNVRAAHVEKPHTLANSP